MSVSGDLKAEVLARMRDLGADRAHTAGVIANHGEQRSTGAVWAVLDALWIERRVVALGRGRYRLPDAGAEQMTMGGEA